MISACMTVSVRELRTAVREWACCCYSWLEYGKILWEGTFFKHPVRLFSLIYNESAQIQRYKCEFKDSIHRLRNAQISTYSPHIFLKFCQSKVGVVKTQKTWT